MKDFLTVHRRSVPFLFLGGFLLLAIPLLLYINQQQRSKEFTSPVVPTIDSSKLQSSAQTVIIGETTGSQIDAFANLSMRMVLDTGAVNYFFPSGNADRPKKIQVNEKGIAAFERIVINEQTSSDIFVTVTEYITNYGDPEVIVQGSHFYGPEADTYIFAGSGVALIATGDNVHEVHYFIPTSVENYVNNYGEDIAPISEASGVSNGQEVLIELPLVATASATPALE